VDKDSGLIHSIVTTAANVHDLIPAAELLHSGDEVVYACSTTIWLRGALHR
jgi:IS5 family transposase